MSGDDDDDAMRMMMMIMMIMMMIMMCVRSRGDMSPYQTSGQGARLARLIGRVSTEVTSS